MTYGMHSALMREALGVLLRQHRIQQRIGGAGMYHIPVSSTVAEREEIGLLIRQYRRGVLVWTLQAVEAAAPQFMFHDRSRPRHRRPADALAHRLRQTLEHQQARLAAAEALTEPQPFDLVEHWRKAARAAALGEHDFPVLRSDPGFDGSGALDVLRDAAEVVRAVTVLDRRYRLVPGWQPLVDRGHLEQAATRAIGAAAVAQRDDSGYRVDILGWRAPLAAIPGPARPGFAGVVQAEHNLLIQLNCLPTALNLRRILDSQRELSHRLSLRSTQSGEDLGRRWLERAGTYHRLSAAARDLGGLIGDGSAAAAEGASAVGQLRRLTPDVVPTTEHLRQLEGLFDRIDARIADAIAHGARHQLYVTKATTPEFDPRDGFLVHGPRAAFQPITSPVQTALLEVIRTQLRPRRVRVAPGSDAAQERGEFRAALIHRPGEVALSGPAI